MCAFYHYTVPYCCAVCSAPHLHLWLCTRCKQGHANMCCLQAPNVISAVSTHQRRPADSTQGLQQEAEPTNSVRIGAMHADPGVWSEPCATPHLCACGTLLLHLAGHKSRMPLDETTLHLAFQHHSGLKLDKPRSHCRWLCHKPAAVTAAAAALYTCARDSRCTLSRTIGVAPSHLPAAPAPSAPG